MPVLSLGLCDPGTRPAAPAAYFGLHHEAGMHARFRHDVTARWDDLRDGGTPDVRRLQEGLKATGFLPHGAVDGVFGYVTLSAARLFQEYVRTMEGRAEIGAPDGVVGSKTLGHLDRWRAEGKRAAWAGPNTAAEHARWLAFLGRNRQRMIAAPPSVVRQVAALARTGDTLKPAAWTYSPGDIHLVGVRRSAAQRPAPGTQRRCDDVFVLLVGGLVFTFYGSTDPNLHPSITERRDEPYLVPGQHRYRFGWHLASNRDRVYRGFRPATAGVLVVRDRNGTDALDPADRLDPAPNPTINLHWSGAGTSNWSAGCQVVAGARYGNARGEVVDCRAFAAANYSGLGTGTRGAFNVLVDLVATHAERCQVRDGTVLLYTLVNEEDVEVDPAFGAGFTDGVLARLRA